MLNRVVIKKALKTDLPDILLLQRLAFQEIADRYNNQKISPLVQTQSEILQEFANRTFLKAIFKGKIIGSVRAHQEGDTCYVGRLIVHPRYQNQGIGTILMEKIEDLFLKAKRFEIFTGERDDKNIYLYQKRGYNIFKRENINEKLTLLFLEKRMN
ncbi:MAG: GNAT family N-acetyltransferase [Promethearchaeota archaeon]